jgi:hypothetical protein
MIFRDVEAIYAGPLPPGETSFVIPIEVSGFLDATLHVAEKTGTGFTAANSSALTTFAQVGIAEFAFFLKIFAKCLAVLFEGADKTMSKRYSSQIDLACSVMVGRPLLLVQVLASNAECFGGQRDLRSGHGGNRRSGFPVRARLRRGRMRELRLFQRHR